MNTSQQSYGHRANEPEMETPRALNTPDLLQLFSLDLAYCPRLDHEEEYTLACRTRSAWLHLVTSLKAQHKRLAALLGEHCRPSSYNAFSEREVMRLLRHVQGYVDRTETRATSPDMTSLRNWLARMRADLVRFRGCRDEMVRRNLRFVVMLARRYKHSRVSFLDLVQEGTLGLMCAVEKFDPARGVTFASYAVWWIREAFAHALASKDDTVCVSAIRLREEEDGSLL